MDYIDEGTGVTQIKIPMPYQKHERRFVWKTLDRVYETNKQQ